MIVRQLPGRVHLISQPDHAHLAGRVMEHCTSLADSPRRQSILLAIREHDNGWEEEDASPTVDLETGNVVDFVTAPLAVRHRVWPRAIERLSSDPWAAALVAQHALTVYDRYRTDPAWTTFFEKMAVLRDRMIEASPASAADLAADYPFVRLGDLISLTFCTGWTDAQRFGEWVVESAGGLVTVEPSPFAASIPFEISARELPTTPFRSDAELRDALVAAPRVVLKGQIAR